MGHSLCSFILRQIPRRSPTHNAVYFTTTRLGGYTLFSWHEYAKDNIIFIQNGFIAGQDFPMIPFRHA